MARPSLFVRSLEHGGRRPGTVRNTFFVLKMVLDYAIKDGKVSTNPCQAVDLPSPASPDMLFLTAAEVRMLAARLDANVADRPRSDWTAPYGLMVEFAGLIEPVPTSEIKLYR